MGSRETSSEATAVAQERAMRKRDRDGGLVQGVTMEVGEMVRI